MPPLPPPRPTPLSDAPKVLFGGMAIVQCAALGYLAQSYVFPIAMAVLVFIGMSELIQFSPSDRAKKHIITMLFSVFVAKYELVSAGLIPSFPSMPLAPLNHITVQALLAFQTALFFIRPFPSAPYLPLTGILALTITANRSAVYLTWWGSRSSTPSVLTNEHFIYRLLAMFFTVLLVFYLNATVRRALVQHSRRGRFIILSVLTLLTCVLASIGSEMAAQLDQNANKWAEWWSRKSGGDHVSAGFSSNPWFESIRHWQQTDQDAVALRIYAASPPGYLRGRTFTEVSLKKHCGWGGSSLPGKTTTPVIASEFKNLPSPEPNEKLFPLRADATSQTTWDAMTVYPVQHLEDELFSPLEAAVIAARLDSVQTDSSGVVTSNQKPASYRYFIPPVPLHETLTSETRQLYLNLPNDVDARIPNIARQALGDEKTARGKMRAVERYFHTNYRYELSVTYAKMPEGVDVITYFLTEKTPAHCEYFATGAAIFLRLSGVPCRYVNGFVAEEKNVSGGYWLARNRHAHAWVEAYDDETQTWVTVEATPPSGVPTAQPVSFGKLRAWWDSFKFFLTRLWNTLRNLDFKATLSLLASGLATLLPLPVVIGLFCATLAFLFFRKMRKNRRGLP
ncbi:TPA: hypothetical protein DDW35_03785, partial [Candidatus Sumerlaeota bacterium]|nr:hypothetical protein [Candidatus Sumerlaeota bacterium]